MAASNPEDDEWEVVKAVDPVEMRCGSTSFEMRFGFDSYCGEDAESMDIIDGNSEPVFKHCARRQDLGGFSYYKNKVYFRKRSVDDLLQNMQPSPEVVFFIKKN